MEIKIKYAFLEEHGHHSPSIKGGKGEDWSDIKYFASPEEARKMEEIRSSSHKSEVDPKYVIDPTYADSFPGAFVLSHECVKKEEDMIEIPRPPSDGVWEK